MSTDRAHPVLDPDEALVRRMALGDQGACAALLDRHLDRIHGLAQRLLGNEADADEVAQDTFLRAWQQASHWQPGGARFGTWLYRVALNLCRDRRRASRPAAFDAQDLQTSDSDSPERRASTDELVTRLADALDRLPPRQREALVLAHDQGLSQREIAETLAIGVEAVESLLARARRAMRTALKDGPP